MLRCNTLGIRLPRMPEQVIDPQVPPPPLVYPAPDSDGLWIVESPVTPARVAPNPVVFTGPDACGQALRYAYEEFGSARFIPFTGRG